MSRYNQKPNNALKWANEYIEVGKPSRALNTLYDVIKSKRNRASTYSEKTLEPIMLKYLDLCVELKQSHLAKEGLFQYRNICQAVNVASLETVVRKYLEQAEERTESAREKSHQTVVDIDDLDNMTTPEQILLSAVSGEDTQDRTDRAILTPWVKFLWESYRQCLELLRTNARVEKLYHEIAQQAFKFCLKYSRKTELRKLCENLRTHLQMIIKQQQTGAATGINLNNVDSQHMNLETRLAQLDTAIQMELWQEAYKATEDIHGLMALSKIKPKPQMMANYYQKLSLVFWKAGNYLYHSAALFKLFQLSKDLKKNMSATEIQKMASQVLVATLAVPLPSAHPEFDRFIETEKNALEKSQKLATLLDLQSPPARQKLVKDLTRLNILQHVPQELKDLYMWLEDVYHPLDMCRLVQSCFAFIETTDSTKHLVQYVPALQDITLVRLIKQVAQVYQTIKIERLLELSLFADVFHLEKIIVDLARHNDMQVRIDHRSRSLHFGSDLSEAQREDLAEGPTIQAMPSEQIRNQLILMYTSLYKAVGVVQPSRRKKEREEVRKVIHTAYQHRKQMERHKILDRQRIIENRKEMLEKLNNKREEEERRAQEEQLQKHLEAEQLRLQKEAEERELKRREDEKREISMKHMKDKIEQLSQTAIGQKIIAKMAEEELYKLDADTILQKQVEELEREKQELQQKLKAQYKKVDHLERAKRIEEIPLLQMAFEKKRVEDKLFWEEQEQSKIMELKESQEIALKHHNRLSRLREDKDLFLKQIQAERSNSYKSKMAEFNKMLTDVRQERLLERRRKRKDDRKYTYYKAKEEEMQRKKEEELQRKKEEEERQRMERARKLDEIAEKQKKREMEIEEKLRRESETFKVRKPEKSEPESWRRSDDKEEKKDIGVWRPKENSSWRKKVAEKEGPWHNEEDNDREKMDRDIRGDRDVGRGDRDVGRGDRDIGRGDRDIGRGDRDIGRGRFDRDRDDRPRYDNRDRDSGRFRDGGRYDDRGPGSRFDNRDRDGGRFRDGGRYDDRGPGSRFEKDDRERRFDGRPAEDNWRTDDRSDRSRDTSERQGDRKFRDDFDDKRSSNFRRGGGMRGRDDERPRNTENQDWRQRTPASDKWDRPRESDKRNDRPPPRRTDNKLEEDDDWQVVKGGRS